MAQLCKEICEDENEELKSQLKVSLRVFLLLILLPMRASAMSQGGSDVADAGFRLIHLGSSTCRATQCSELIEGWTWRYS